MIKSAIFAAEAIPFAKTGGLADVSGTLPQALNNSGCETIVIMPGYEHIFSKFKDTKKLMRPSNNTWQLNLTPYILSVRAIFIIGDLNEGN